MTCYFDSWEFPIFSINTINFKDFIRHFIRSQKVYSGIYNFLKRNGWNTVRYSDWKCIHNVTVYSWLCVLVLCLHFSTQTHVTRLWIQPIIAINQSSHWQSFLCFCLCYNFMSPQKFYHLSLYYNIPLLLLSYILSSFLAGW